MSRGRTGCSRQRCQHGKPPAHHLLPAPGFGPRGQLVPHGSSSPGCLWFASPPTTRGPPAQLPPARCILLPVLRSSGHAARRASPWDKPGTGHPQLKFFFPQPVPWEKSDCSFTNFRAVSNVAERYLAQRAPREVSAGRARVMMSAWLRDASSEFGPNRVARETDLAPQGVNPVAGGS